MQETQEVFSGVSNDRPEFGCKESIVFVVPAFLIGPDQWAALSVPPPTAKTVELEDVPTIFLWLWKDSKQSKTPEEHSKTF